MASNYSKIFNDLCALLKRQKDNSAAEQAIESTRRRIQTVYSAAIQAGDQPEHPGFNDEVFTKLDWVQIPLPSEAEEPLPEPDESGLIPTRRREGESLNKEYIELPQVNNLAEAQALAAKLQAQLNLEKRRVHRLGAQVSNTKDKIKRMLKAEATGRKYLSHRRIKRPIPPAPCWCGCGEMVTSLRGSVPRRFKSGHNAKYLAEILAVERAGKKIEDLPEILRKNLKWTRCTICRRPIPITDPHGRPIEENIGLACYRRVLKTWWPYTPVSPYS